MKTKARFILGLASAILLSCGWVRAAERLDPTRQIVAPVSSLDRSALGCTGDCGEDTLIEHEVL